MVVVGLETQRPGRLLRPARVYGMLVGYSLPERRIGLNRIERVRPLSAS